MSTCDTDLYKDASDSHTILALYILSVINLVVILQGLYSLKIRR